MHYSGGMGILGEGHILLSIVGVILCGIYQTKLDSLWNVRTRSMLISHVI